MKAYFNNDWIEDTLEISLKDRALQFGDGLFETMIVKNGKTRFLNDHLKRLREGAYAIGLDFDHLSLSERHLTKIIEELLRQNNTPDQARVKLQLWRKAANASGYSPRNTGANLLVTAYPHTAFDYKVRSKVAFSSKVSLVASTTSRFKTMSALPYVIASAECQQRGMDDLVLTDHRGFMSECISSNLFWVLDETLFTPSLSTGCIEGIMRGQVLKKCLELGIEVFEVEKSPGILTSADAVFSVNAAGFYLIQALQKQSYVTKHLVVNQLIESIQAV